MKILVIEDDANSLSLILQTLKKQKFTIDIARDGKEGFSKAKSRKYDAIVLDIMLPHKTGFEIISGLRSLNIKTPILVLSSRSMTEDKVLGLNLGADDYLTKSFAPEELLARVANLMRRNHQTTKNIVKHKNLVIDFSSMHVQRDHKSIKLSRKELGILIALIRQKNHVISRRDLISLVWGDQDMNVDSNTIDVHIKSLRAKVDKPFAEPMINTVRGYGYIIRD